MNGYGMYLNLMGVFYNSKMSPLESLTKNMDGTVKKRVCSLSDWLIKNPIKSNIARVSAAFNE